MVVFRSMTVDEYKNNYMTFQLLYAFHRTPFGKCLIAITDIDEDIAYLTFFDNETTALADLKAKWPLTRTLEDTRNKTSVIVAKIFNPDDSHLHVRVIMKGTEFQIKIWKSLIGIPRGTFTTYEEVARMADYNPKAAIAVGNAISKNYIAYVVPCHRVLSKNMYLHGTKYAWGIERKKAILEYEKQLLS
ncbi:bifunctional transcriptional activator/DNA repair enzyme Ada [Monomorium pharaonis]|uniref:bifunctional transcriptional activator/DNA repair enzyme Ada n=1 Tax=Monomorium pharaonis TaxID=307658 RepID=UPI00063F2109|nr:bifunctional transcriptional activator/DNA repair enzyme Ada [Monomorium pharaonis]XP_012527014.1 bifunctional transcriptional activator/DNA repair enzyme Ada [Monomorium pharaonis]XP_012527015.1 bifunctional transcriptional activator/DNA repair enzyme Ada [Monomorium pharaonis]XP_012527016.1 bifunctional transcriptional activator/DNA repair enzyme Ada [Monomorium pharaonis]XP_036141174.1 bifunctional transcriptional activator/DNA repair enzyme Ada [Monomorium pharaonis]